MHKALLRSILLAGLMLVAGNATAIKGIDSLTGPGNQGSTGKTIERQTVLDAVKEVCSVWNTAAMKATLDPAFPDSDAFINAFGTLPKDAKLVFIDLESFSTTSDTVVAKVHVAVEFTQGGTTLRDTTHLVTWSFKRYD